MLKFLRTLFTRNKRFKLVTSSGTWTPSEDVSHISVQMVGGGGGGGSGYSGHEDVTFGQSSLSPQGPKECECNFRSPSEDPYLKFLRET